MRVLLVDDQDDVRRVARISLETVGGFDTTVAAGPFEALAAVRAQRPDLILMDVMMPGMDGVAAFEELRQDPEFSDIPVVFLTAKARTAEVAEYTRLGAAGVISKPFDPMTLPADLLRMLQLRAERTGPTSIRRAATDSELLAGIEPFVQLARAVAETPVAAITRSVEGRPQIVFAVGVEETWHRAILDASGRTLAEAAPLVGAAGGSESRGDWVVTCLAEPEARFIAGMRLRDPDGGVLGVLSVADRSPLTLDQRQVLILSEIGRHSARVLSSRRRDAVREAAERAAECGTQQFVVAVEACPTGMLMTDESGRVLLANSAFNRLLGYRSDEVLGKSVAAVLPPSLCDLVQFDAPVPKGTLEHTLRRRDGSALAVEIGLTRVRGGKDRRTLISMSDLTSRREMEAIRDRLARQERLVTTGTLAAGVGHEINNPLTYILGNAEFALEELVAIAGASPSTRMRELLDLLAGIRDGAERIRKIVRGLRAFARADSMITAIDVQASLEMSINMAAHELRQRATLITELEPVPAVLADEAGLSQVLVNLLVNAAQAFASNAPESNIIRVRTATAKDGNVSIEVSDNGPGIPAAVLPRIFDPFFTTKPVGKGTGLGLAICHNVVTAFGGTLTCASQWGAGATFQVLLPPAHATPPHEAAPAAAVDAARLRILFIDDEATIGQLATRILHDQHDVTVEMDPRAALRRLVQGQEHFDVILCDLMMPYLTGMDLYRAVIRARPELSAGFAFMTGGALHIDAQAFLAEVSNERLDKPFSVRDLRAAVRRLSLTRSQRGARSAPLMQGEQS